MSGVPSCKRRCEDWENPEEDSEYHHSCHLNEKTRDKVGQESKDVKLLKMMKEGKAKAEER